MAAPALTAKSLTLIGGGGGVAGTTADLYIPSTIGAGFETLAYPPNRPGCLGIDQNGNIYIYLPGVTGTVGGDAVIYNPTTFATTRLATGAVGPVAIAQAANNATTSYGWYLIKGYAELINNSLALAINKQLYVNVGTSTGAVTDTYTAGAQIHGAVSVTSSTGATSGITGYVSYPYVNAVSDS